MSYYEVHNFVILYSIRQIASTKLSLCSIKPHVIKTYGELEINLNAFLNSAIDGDDYSSSSSGLSTQEKIKFQYP
jgi:hypothetical protein